MHRRDEITKKVVNLIAEIASVDVGSIQGDMALMGKDLSLDSLSMVRLIVKLEIEFPKKLQVNDMTEFGVYTVTTLVDRLSA